MYSVLLYICRISKQQQGINKMNVSQVDNSGFLINYSSAKDFAQAQKMVDWIEIQEDKRVVCASVDHYEDENECVGYFQMTTVWDWKAATDLRWLYKEAKKATK